jgi:hypothetical protein
MEPSGRSFGEILARNYQRAATLWVLIPALMLTGVFAFLWAVAGRMVIPGGTTGVELQMAFTPSRFAAVVQGWGPGVETFKTTLMILDFAFPLAYATALSSLVVLIAGGPPAGARLWLFSLPWAAAACDWVENLLHLGLLANVHDGAAATAAAFPAVLVTAASAAATVKFALVLTGLLGAVVAAIPSRRR